MHWRTLASLAVTLVFIGAARAQTYSLSEAPLVDSYHHVQLSLSLAGTLKLQQDGKERELKESANAAHDYVERVLEPGPENTAARSARAYKDAKVTLVVNDNKLEHGLRADRTFLMAQRDRDGTMIYCPKGCLTREELDVTDHFETLAVTGLLPAKEVAVGETWKLGNLTVQTLCHLQGLSEHTLAGKLDNVQDDIARFSISGTVTGIDLGVTVSANIKAACQFDLKQKCLIAVEWTQKDERGAGPVSPASSMETTIKLLREAIEPVNDLADVLVPKSEPTSDVLDLYYKDAKDRFELQHARVWQMVGRSDQHVVWRLMDRGEFVAQASLAPWQKAEPGKHLSAEEVKSIVANSPGWAQDTLIKAEEVKLPSGQWAYLVAGEGDLDGARAVQYFYLIAGPGGDQAMLTFTMTPAQVQKLGSRDLEFVRGFLLPGARPEGAELNRAGDN